MADFWYWTSMILFAIGMPFLLSAFIAQILFVAWYGEQIRKLIINMPSYIPCWGGLTDLSKPIKAWDIMGVVFFTWQIQNAVFSKKSSPIADQLKARLPKKIKRHLWYINSVGLTSLGLFFVSGGITYLQQYG